MMQRVLACIVALAPAWLSVQGATAADRYPDRPIRVRQTESVLEGAAPRESTADHAAETLAAEIKPIDDVRSTAEYRRVVAARVLHRLLRDAGGW